MKEIDLSDTIKELSLIESFFHGKSSGLDPLTSYLNSPILVNANKSLKKIDKTLFEIYFRNMTGPKKYKIGIFIAIFMKMLCQNGLI